MLIFQTGRLLDKYRPLFFALLLFCCYLPGRSQTYNASTCCTVSNKSYGAAQAVSTDGRSWFYDATNFVMRDYNGTSEVVSYLNLAKYRSGHFPIYVHSGGLLQGNGVWLGGITLVYWFKDSTGNANLVRWYTDSTGMPGGPFYAVANNLSEGNAGLIKGNLALDNVDNTSDAQKNAASVALTNHTIDANNNSLLHIPNSALTNNSIGLTINANPASDISVTTTPAALGTALVVNMPDGGAASRGPITALDWNFFNGKLDSVHISNDSVYNCVNGTCTLQSVISGAGAVNSVDGTNTSLLFSPMTGNVLGQVNPAYAFNWTGQHTYTSFAPIFSTLTTAGGIFYGNGSGQLLQSGAGTTGQIFQSAGGTAPIFFTPDASTVTGWLGYTPLSGSLGSTHIFVGNGSNIATDVAASGAWTMNNVGVSTLTTNSVATSNIQNNAVTYAKFQALSTQSLLGATSAGNVQEITLGTNLSMAGSVLNATTASGVLTKAGPSPYLRKVGTDSVAFNLDSTGYYLGLSTKKYGTPWQYSYDNFWTATTSNGFQVTGVTAGVSGNKITLTGTVNNYLQKYQKTRISYFEHWIMEDTIVLTSAPAATTSIGIGIDNIANLGRVDLSNTGTAGKAYIVTGTTDRATSAGNITFAQNDTLVLKFQQMRDTLTFTVTNKANASTTNVQLLLPNSLQVGSTDSIHVAGQFSIFVKGSSSDHYTLVSQRISILEPQGSPLILFGDSKYEGGYVTTWNARTADRLRALGFNVVQLGSSGSSLSDLYTRLQDLTSLYPSQVILQGYSNDIRQGLSVAQTAINYENLKDLLESYGYKVWVLTAPELGSLASQMRQFDSTVRQRYPQDYIPVYDAMAACGSPCLTVDLIHWTDRGNDTVTKYTAKYVNNPLYNSDKPIDQVLRTEFAKTKNNVVVIGANNSYLATSGNFIIGHNTTAPLILKAKGRTTTFGYATNTPWIRFTSESGASSGDIISDSLGNTGMGINAFLTTPTGQNNVLFGRAVAALQNASNNRVTAVGSFANNGGGTISAYDVSNSTFFGFEAGYYENTPNKGYIANSRSSNLFYNDYSARKLIVYPSQTGTSVPVFLTTDQFQVNGSSYFLDSVRLGKVPDATLTTDSIAISSNNGSGNIRTLKKAAIGLGLSLSGGVLSATAASAPFSDASALVKNSSDATKLLILSAASISTATTRTWTFPDVNGTVARNDAAQTFTGIQTYSSSPIIPTATAGDNSTKGASTAYVDAAIAAAPKLVYTAVGATQAVNTTSETSIAGVGPGSLTIAANALTVGKTYRFKIAGIYNTALVPGNCTFRLKIGSVTIGSGTVSNLAISGSALTWTCTGTFVCWTTGSSGTVINDANMGYATGSLTALNSVPLNNGGVVSTINTTISNALDFTVQWATADVSNAWKANVFTLEGLN